MQFDTYKDIDKDINRQKTVLSEKKRTANKMKEQNIHKLLANGERVTLECKKTKTCVRSFLWETYLSFASFKDYFFSG